MTGLPRQTNHPVVGRSCKPRVVICTETPTPYQVGRFNAIAQRNNLDFEAWFLRRRESDRSWQVDEGEWAFVGRYLKPDAGLRPGLKTALDEFRRFVPDLTITGYADAFSLLVAATARTLGSRIAYRVVANYPSVVHTPGWKQLIKRFLFRAADGAEVPGDHARDAAERYGFPVNRIVQSTQSIDVAHYSRALDVGPVQRAVRQRELGLHGCVFVYVGRLLKWKGLDDLLAAYRQIRKEGFDASLLLVGDGADEKYYRATSSHCEGVVFVGFIQPNELPSYYALGDVFVFPSYGEVHGLAVDEAMSAGLPVIASDAVDGIRDRVVDGESGYLVPPRDPIRLSERMRYFVTDSSAVRLQGARARLIIAASGHERYARDIETLTNRILGFPRRCTMQAYVEQAIGHLVLAMVH